MQKDLGDLANLAWELLEKLFGSHSVEEWRRLLPVSLWEALMRLDPKGSMMPRITSAENWPPNWIASVCKSGRTRSPGRPF